MIYFMFYNRMLTKKQIKRNALVKEQELKEDDSRAFEQLRNENVYAYQQARAIKQMSNCHLYQNTTTSYYDMGESLFPAMVEDLKKAEKFIFMEYFIVEEGHFWNSILDVLKEKAAQGVEVRVLYDDIGCMMTLPGDYYKTLQSFGIKAVPFSRLKGQADNEFNNRSHRKMTIIDGKVGYTGGVNIADEYINEKLLFGKWKDVGVRLEGEVVTQMTSTFLADYELNVKTAVCEFKPYFDAQHSVADGGFVIPFGDGPEPVYKHRVAQTALMNMLNQAQKYVYMMSPYLIIDEELCQAIENAVMRGVDVRIIVPHIPDKKIVFLMTKSFYKRLMESGVKVYEYEPGFVHAKVYLADDCYGMVGTSNLDYRSLVHHFENNVWFYKHSVLEQVKADMQNTMAESILMEEHMIKDDLVQKIVRALVRVFAPML